jgi:hypothetical protein
VIKSREIRWIGHVARMGEGLHTEFEGKIEGNRKLVRPRRRWENNINMGIQVIG